MKIYKDQEELLNTDWQAKINQAVDAGDFLLAAQYEQARNDKINSPSYTGKQTTTDKYSQYLTQDKGGAAALTSGTPESVSKYTSIPSFDYASFEAKKPKYASNYADRIDAMLDDILNREAFSYNAEADPMFQQYQKQYQREGRRAVEDTLATLATNAGGMNSYAVTAAQQASDYYNAQMGDRIPELVKLAYEMYMQDYNQDVNSLALLRQQEAESYGRYQNDLADWYAQLEAAYNQHRDAVADNQWQQSFDYQAQQDALAYQQWLEQMEYQKAQDELAQQNWQQQFDYGKEQDALAYQKWLEQMEYQKAQDLIAQQQWREQFDYGKSQDALAQKNWLEQMEYQMALDKIAQDQWQQQFDHNKAQDAIDNAYRQDVFDYEKGLAGYSGGSYSSGSSSSSGGSKAPTKEQIKEMQNFYEVDPDGIWGKESSAAAGGQSAEQAWQEYEDVYSPPVRSEPKYDEDEDVYVAPEPAPTNKYTGTNFMQDAIDAAMRGDRETAEAALAARAEKMSSPDYHGTGGGTSMEEAWAQIEQLLAANQEDDNPAPSIDTDGRTYNNGTLTRDQIAEMQNFYEVDPDGLWGKNSTAAAGGQTAEQAWAEYAQMMGYTDEPETSRYDEIEDMVKYMAGTNAFGRQRSSDTEILTYLDQFSEDELSDEELENIMSRYHLGG